MRNQTGNRWIVQAAAASRGENADQPIPPNIGPFGSKAQADAWIQNQQPFMGTLTALKLSPPRWSPRRPVEGSPS